MTIDWFQTPSHWLRYAVRHGTGPSFVLLHEMGGSLESWDLVAPLLPDDATIVLPEMRGMGQSDAADQPFRFEDLAADVESLLDHLSITGPVVIAGCAVGGAVALRLGLMHPGRCSAVVAFGPACSTPAAKREAVMGIADTLESQGLAACESMLLQKTYPERFQNSAPKHFQTMRQRWLENDPQSFANYFRALAQTDMTPDLAQLQVPVVCVAGTQDAFRPPDYVQSLAQIIPHAQFVEIDAGHHHADHAPETVARILRQAAQDSRGAGRPSLA